MDIQRATFKDSFSFINFMFVTRKWENKILTIALETQSEFFYFLTMELVTWSEIKYFSTSR